MKLLMALVAATLLTGATLIPEKSVLAWKIADRNLGRIFKDKVITKKNLELVENDSITNPINFENHGIYQLLTSNNSLGYLVFASSLGRYESFDYMIVFNPDLSVKQIDILKYTSSHGGEIASQKWLKQFVGYKGAHLTYGSDIDAITGATYSATSLVKDVESITIFMKKIKHLP